MPPIAYDKSFIDLKEPANSIRLSSQLNFADLTEEDLQLTVCREANKQETDCAFMLLVPPLSCFPQKSTGSINSIQGCSRLSWFNNFSRQL